MTYQYCRPFLTYRLYPNNPEVVARKVNDVSKRIVNDEYIPF